MFAHSYGPAVKIKKADPLATRKHPVPRLGPSTIKIRIRAYEIYMERGEQPDHDLDDWLQAERELESVRIRCDLRMLTNNL